MIKTKYKAHTRKWFVSRIGKRIYRYGGSCRCEHCKKTLREGLVVAYMGREGRMHADYLYDCQNEMGLRYSDRPFKENRKSGTASREESEGVATHRGGGRI